MAIARAMPSLQRTFAWDVDAAKAERFAREMGKVMRLEITATTTIPQADIVVTCTSSSSPFLTPECVRPGTFIAAVGADNPHKSEIHPELLKRAKVVTDLTSQALLMGDLHHAIAARACDAAHVHAELGELIVGSKPGRIGPDEITLFDSTGVAIQDVAAAAWVYERAVASKEIANA